MCRLLNIWDYFSLEYLPQHLLGDMWGRFWTNLYKIAVPYPAEPSLDVTENMRKQNYTVRRMYETSDEFYKSMGLIPLPSTFFNVSMLERPEGRDVICHATAWDFYDGKDFRWSTHYQCPTWNVLIIYFLSLCRIKMCTNINMDDFLTVSWGNANYWVEEINKLDICRFITKWVTFNTSCSMRANQLSIGMIFPFHKKWS